MDYVGAVLVTGASRRIGIGSEVVRQLAGGGWNVFTTWWTPDDATMPWGAVPHDTDELLTVPGVVGMQADLSDPDVPAIVFDAPFPRSDRFERW